MTTSHICKLQYVVHFLPRHIMQQQATYVYTYHVNTVLTSNSVSLVQKWQVVFSIITAKSIDKTVLMKP